MRVTRVISKALNAPLTVPLAPAKLWTNWISAG
jgi:hypothetical protein